MEDPYLIKAVMEDNARKRLLTPKGLETRLKWTLNEIKSVMKIREGKVGTIYFGDNSEPYKNNCYNIGFQKGSPIVTASIRGKCPAYATTIGEELFKEIFDINHKIDRMPTFDSLTIGQKKWYIGGGVYIDVNKGVCPFDTFDKKHRFSSKTFIEFLGRVKLKGYTGAVESVEDILQNFDFAVHELLSKYSPRGNSGYPLTPYNGKCEDILVMKNDESKYTVRRRK